MLLLLLVADTLRVAWPDSTVILPGCFSDRITLVPDVPHSLRRDTLRLFLLPGQEIAVIYEPLPGDWTRPRALFPEVGEEPPEGERIVQEKPSGTEALNFSGEKTMGLSFTGAGMSLDDVTRLSVSGRARGVALDGYMEETGFSGSEFTGELAEVDKAYLTASTPRGAMSLGNLREELFLAGGSGSLKFLGLSGRYGPSELWGGYQRGEFTYKVFSGEDAFQGPYQLTEPGQTVLPNSERIYLNGDLLTGGPDGDYILDPLTGTLVFTAKRPIRAEDRIRCEFQVQESGKNRYFAAGASDQGPWRFEILRAWDDLSVPDIPGMDTLGDTSWAWVPGARFVGQGNGSYIRQDTIYSYVGPGQGDWDVSFSYMGQGEGDYIYDSFLGGYRFVGWGQGDYAPMIRLSPPEEKLYAGISFQKSPGPWSFSGFARASDYDRNTLSDMGDGDNRGVCFGGNGSFSAGWVSGGLGLESRDSSFSYPFAGVAGNEDRVWGIQDKKGVEKRGGNAWSEIRPWPWLSLRPEIGLVKMGGLSSLRRGVELAAWSTKLSHHLITLSNHGWMTQSTARSSLTRGLWVGSLGLERDQGDTLDTWRADASVSGHVKKMLTGASGLFRWDRGKIERTLTADLRGPGPTLAWDTRYILRNWAGDTTGTEHHFLGGASLNRDSWAWWGRARLAFTSRQITEERFIYVGPGQGDWDYDTSSGGFYPYPGGSYLRQIVYLESFAPAVERWAETGVWATPGGASLSLSGSGEQKLSGGQIFYSDYSGSLFLSGTRGRTRPFLDAGASWLRDGQSLPGRAWNQQFVRTGLRHGSSEPGLEAEHDASFLGDDAEREVLRGGAYYRITLLWGLDTKLSGARLMAQEPLYHPGVIVWMWELGLAPSYDANLGEFFLSLSPGFFYRWGEENISLEQVFATYPPGFSYVVSAALKIGRGGSATLSGYLRGDETGLRDKRLSVSVSMLF